MQRKSTTSDKLQNNKHKKSIKAKSTCLWTGRPLTSHLSNAMLLETMWPTMWSRSSVACWSCFWDPLIMKIISVKVWHTAWLPSSFRLSFLSSSVMLRLQFKGDVMPCSWAKSLPVEASSEENCLMKASRASERTKEQIKPELSLSRIFSLTGDIIFPGLCGFNAQF